MGDVKDTLSQIRDALAGALSSENLPALLRILGGVVFGAGALVLFTRKSSPLLGETWGDAALFAVLFVPAVVLYGLGIAGERLGRIGGPRGEELPPWRSVLLVFGVVLTPLALFQLVELLDGDTGAPLNVFWIFLVTAGLAGAASWFAGASYQVLLGAIAVIIAWTSLWDEITGLADDLGLYRAVMLILAAAFLIGALLVVQLRDRLAGGVRARRVRAESRSRELVTGAGIAAVVATGLGITSVPGVASPIPLGFPEADSSVVWDALLLITSLALLLYAARAGTRGAAYVGAIGRFAFVLVVGVDADSGSPEGELVGWPLVLLLLGAGALAASFVPKQRLKSVLRR
jgi:hypothetical protein